MKRTTGFHKRASSAEKAIPLPDEVRKIAGKTVKQPSVGQHAKRSKRALASLTTLWRQDAASASVSTRDDSLPPAPPASASKSQKKTWRKSYDAKYKATPVPELPEACIKNNPEFSIFAHYKHDAALYDQSYASFDSVWEEHVLAALPALAGRSLEDGRTIIKSLCRDGGIDFSVLEQDPYAMLNGTMGFNNIEADLLRLMPVLLKMVLWTGLEMKVVEPGGKASKDTPYICSTEFENDWRQLQLALAMSLPAFAELAAM